MDFVIAVPMLPAQWVAAHIKVKTSQKRVSGWFIWNPVGAVQSIALDQLQFASCEFVGPLQALACVKDCRIIKNALGSVITELGAAKDADSYSKLDNIRLTGMLLCIFP